MAITVVKYPQGYITSQTAEQALVTDSSGDALFNDTGHGLIDGDYIYIASNSSYNGYWYVNQISASTFKIRPYAAAADVEYVGKDVDVSYYEASAVHGWNCAHLPIVYKLKSDSWPINGVDTSRTVTTFTNWNGYTYLVLDGDLKSSGTASTLENVVISGVTGVGGADIEGVYRIIQWFSDTNIVIDLAYDAGNVLSGGTCQYYYLHYHAKVKIYAGLDSGHSWAFLKPYREIAEVKVTFDSNGEADLNVSKYVKSEIETFSNNLNLDSLPNNLDAWCRVKISVAESYDDSDGYTIEEYTGSYTEDTTEIYAVNAINPFKTREMGSLSGYVPTNGNQFFLTPFTQPSLFPDWYFDLSFIKNTSSSGDYLKIDRYSKAEGNYTLVSSALSTVTDYDQGVYRWQIAQSGSEDRIDVTYYNSGGTQLSDTITIDVDNTCSPYDTSGIYLTWLNYLGGYDYWFFKAQTEYSIDVIESKTQDINIYNNWPNSWGEFADSVTKQSVRRSKNAIKLNSQFLTKDQVDALAWIVSSPLVQVMSVVHTNIYTVRTVIVDTSTFRKYQDRQNLYSVSFNIMYTDELPAQTI
jgi:hypothetical protein